MRMTPSALYPLTQTPIGSRRLRGVPSRAAAPASLDRSWDLLLLCVAVYLATAVGRVHQVFAFMEPFQLALVSAAMALGLYLLSQGGPRDLGRLWCPTTIALLTFLGWAALSVPGALHDGLAFRLLLDPLLKSVVLGLLVAGAVRGVRDVERMAFVYFLAAAVFAGVAIARFGTAIKGASWGILMYYDANDFATYAVTALPFAGYFIFTRRSWIQRLVSLAGAVVLVVALVWSNSRGGFLALVAAGLCGLVAYRAIPASWRIGAALTAVAAVAVAAGPGYWERITRGWRPGSDYNWTNEAGRIQIWQRGASYAFQHPVFGVGAGNFAIAEGTISELAQRQRYGVGLKWSAPHNSFIQVGAEVGFPGLALFVLALVLTLRALLRIAARPPPAPHPVTVSAPLLAQSMVVSFAGFLVGAFFLSLAYTPMLYALLGLAIGLAKVEPVVPPAPTGYPVRARQSFR